MSDIMIKRLSKSFDDKSVLRNISLNVKNGERLAIMAPSGYGKTTLLRLLLGLDSPDTGEISGVPDKAAAVFQEDRLFEEFSVRTNVRATRGEGTDNKKIDSILRALELDKDASKPVKKLSGGMKRRVAIARALASDYEIIFLDEPFKGLDPDLKSRVVRYVDESIGERTLILVTHDADDAAALQCRIIDLPSLATDSNS